jgi:chaperonin GroEL (HSP60 family)
MQQVRIVERGDPFASGLGSLAWLHFSFALRSPPEALVEIQGLTPNEAIQQLARVAF